MSSQHHRFTSKIRISATFVVLAASLIAVAAGAGVGFAQGSSSIAQYQYGQKVTICHKTRSTKHPHVTITVAQAAVKAHLKHGDSLGACVAQAPASTTAAPQHGNHGKKSDPPAGAATQSPSTSTAPGKSGDHPNHGHGK